MLFRLLFLLAAVAPYTFADVEFTTPAVGSTETGGSTLDIEWKESGTGPPITSFSTYQLFLCAGGNEAGSFVSTQNACTQIRLGLVVPLLMFQSQVQLITLSANGQFSAGNSAAGTIQVGLGAPTKNA